MNDEITMLEKQIHELKCRLTKARRAAEPQDVRDHELVDAQSGEAVHLSDLFGDKEDLIVVHNMGRKCSYCTLWADGFNGLADHLNDRAAFVLCSADDAPTAKKFAESRGWAFRVVSGADSPFAQAMGFEPEPGKVWPGVSAFRKRPDGSIVRTGKTTLGPGDDYCSAWHLFDLLEGGVGEWAPKFSYA